MTNRTIENLVDEKVLEKIKKEKWFTMQDVIEEFEPLCENSDDLDEIMDIVGNSDRYNYVNSQDGTGYIFGTTEKDIEIFINSGKFDDDDPAWNEYVTCGNSSYKLSYFVDID